MICNEPPWPPTLLPLSLEILSTIGVPAGMTVCPSTMTSFQTSSSTGYRTLNLFSFDVIRSSSSPNTTVPARDDELGREDESRCDENYENE